MADQFIPRSIDDMSEGERTLLEKARELARMRVVLETRAAYFRESPNAGADEIARREIDKLREKNAEWEKFWNEHRWKIAQFVPKFEIEVDAHIKVLVEYARALAVAEKRLMDLQANHGEPSALDSRQTEDYEEELVKAKIDLQMDQELWLCVSRYLSEESRNALLSGARIFAHSIHR